MRWIYAYQATMVTGCATENLIFLAMFMSRTRLATTATASWMALMTVSLRRVVLVRAHEAGAI